MDFTPDYSPTLTNVLKNDTFVYEIIARKYVKKSQNPHIIILRRWVYADSIYG